MTKLLQKTQKLTQLPTFYLNSGLFLNNRSTCSKLDKMLCFNNLLSKKETRKIIKTAMESLNKEIKGSRSKSIFHFQYLTKTEIIAI